MALQTLGSWLQPSVGFTSSALAFSKPNMLPARQPQGFAPVPATSQSEIAATLQRLSDESKAWVDTPLEDRASLLYQCVQSARKVAEEASMAAEKAKGSYGAGHGEEYLGWFMVIWGIKEYAESLAAGAQPKPNRLTRRQNGQRVVEVFPKGWEAILFGGVRGELWIRPGFEASQGALYCAKKEGNAPSQGRVALVLGAGNQASVICHDILHMLMAEDAVVICKMNPVNEYLGPYIRQAFLPLVEAGFLEIVYGAGEEGAYLCSHPLVSAVHLTGSAATYDSIVWGKQPKGKGATPPCSKQITAELGCITPYIIVPGKWTLADMEYHANEIVAGLINNSGHNCTKAEILITDVAWDQREQFLEVLRKRMDEEPCRVAWYPGSAEKVAQALRSIPGLQELGQARESWTAPAANGHHVPSCYPPWLLSTGLSPDKAQTQVENWIGVLQEVALPGTDADVDAFLPAAVDFCNKECWGSLSASIFIHPTVQRAHSQAVEDAISSLQYGAVTVNCPSFVAYAIPYLAWGAYPGNQPHDIGSGNCFVHNVCFYDNVEKTVMWSPWRTQPTHLYDPKHRNLAASVRAAINFVVSPGMRSLIPAAFQALRG